MGKWNCHGCGTNLENNRINAEFPLPNDAAAIYCKPCAKKVKYAFIACLCCAQQVPARGSLGGRFCNGICEMTYYKKRMGDQL